MLISVIIPVYNVEKYLDECIESAIAQTHRELEIILVDDGSMDNSPMMCDEWSKRDNRIKVIHKQNEGPSIARNIGLREAQGDYVIYMDSDDFWANEHCLENLLEEVKLTPECDFIGFNCSYYYTSTKKVVKWVEYASEIQNSINSEDCIEKLVESGTFPMSQCLKILKREIALKLEFKSGIYAEDILWFIELLRYTQKCRFVNHYMYMYRKTNDSSRSATFSYKRYNDLFNIMTNNVGVKYQGWKESTHNALLSFWAYEYLILIGQLWLMSENDRKKWRLELKKYDWMLNYKLNPKVRFASRIKSILGYTIMEILLGKYMKKRKTVVE